MFESREVTLTRVAASVVLLFVFSACSSSLPPPNTLTGPLGFTVNGSGGASGPVVVGGPTGGAGVGMKILLADVSLADACVSGASITCAPSSQRVEIDITHLGAIPLGTPLDIAADVAVLRQSVVGGTTCSTLLGTAIAGSVTITASDGMHIAGTFSVTMQATGGGTSTLTGTFNVNFCQALVPGGGTTGGTSTGGASTGGSSGGTTGGTTGGGTTSGGATSGGSSSGGTTGGGTTGGAGNCAPSATWQGDYCTVPSCTGQPDQAGCTLTGGARGQCFGGACLALIDLTSDPNNCGWYGASCPPGVNCLSSICRPDVRCSSSPAPACPTGTGCMTNPNYTPSGVCVPPSCGTIDGQACPINNNFGGCCGGTCQDTLHDSANCGGCGVACAATDFCDLGRCQPKPDCTKAPAGTRCGFSPTGGAAACCGPICIDVSSDAANCGSCGLACAQGTACTNGYCSQGCATAGCAAGLTCANYTACVLADCSSTSEGSACAAVGTLATTVGVCCQSACISLQSDTSNCGACGRACGTGTVCVQGSCRPPVSFDCANNPGAVVPNSPGDTFSLCCAGVVVDAYTDPKNCGGCGLNCPVGSTCNLGCKLASGGPSSCSANNPCAGGLDCVQGLCVGSICTAAEEGQRCSIVGTATVLGTCCGAQCINTTSDMNNCYACGRACPTGSTTCSSPSCLNATGQQTCAAGSCPTGSNCSSNYCLPTDCTGKGDRTACSFGPGTSGNCCAGICQDLRQAGNCRACGSDCPSGICTPTCITQPTADFPVACPADAICVLGQCVNGFCSASGTPCAMATGAVGYCCGDRACADLANDPDS